MKQSHVWLLAMLTVLAPMTISTNASAEETAHTSGSIEIGATATDIEDNAARVNEYVKYQKGDGADIAGKLDLEAQKGFTKMGLSADIYGPDNYNFGFEVDNRVLKLGVSSEALQHWKDHETLDQMGATARDDNNGGQPNVTTDKTFIDLAEAGYATSVAGENSATFPYDVEESYTQEVANDYLVTRQEDKLETSLTLPALPNVVFHAGVRIETREGMEQAISLSKCDSCHISAVGKNIDEKTEDFTLGATGKFGPVTVDYEYLNRSFTEDSAAPTRYYIDANQPNRDHLNYDDGILPFARTPDSDKDSHSLKARADFANSTSVTASYVKSDIESSKAETQDAYELLNGDKLESEIESFGGKVSTKLGDNLRLSLRGSQYEIEVSNNEIFFPARELETTAPTGGAGGDWPGEFSDVWHSAEAREVKELGFDAVYRLAKATTLRLGYEYEEVEREEAELGETETNTFKVSAKTRFNNKWSGRMSYQYQDINDPLRSHVGIAQGDSPLATADPLGSGLWYYDVSDFGSPSAIWYWTDAYPNRQLEASNLPEEVHEAKASATWIASPNLSATLFARVRMEENDSTYYEQDTYVPGASLYYAPNGKLNLTMAYTFNKQETENQMCVGWYHG